MTWRNLPQLHTCDRLPPNWHDVFRSKRRDHCRLLAYLALGLALTVIIYQLARNRYREGFLLYHDDRPAADKELVFAATHDSDMSWVSEYLSDWRANIYRVDDSWAALTVPQNKGHEAMAYLTFMIDRYWNLPEVTIFMHDKRYQWHNDNPLYDGVISIEDLQLDFVKSAGYVNLRCAWMWGCPTELEPARYLRERPDDPMHPTAMEFPDRFMELFPSVEVPEKVGIPCCSQFALSREKILERPREDYVRYRQWLLNTTLPDGTSGRIMEYSWHRFVEVIFGKPSQHCLDPRICYCQTYGYCNMTDQDLEKQWVWRGETLPPEWPWNHEGVTEGRPRNDAREGVVLAEF
ncbi:hypothetical protein VTN77DRAFT_122 [Rasamsonia byssochlamydoides]|uniref:uncharacterized protein n=1 Tax=Rasamsonia byssochlamydoides TaxID=89139 RepID=UPI00374215C3